MERDLPSLVGVPIRDLQQEEYETRLFGFSARSVFEEVGEDIVPQVIKIASQSLKDCLAENFRHDNQLEKISLATDELIKKCNSSAVAPLQKLKKALDGHFQIPSNVLLPEDMVQCNQYTDDEIEKVNQEIRDLKIRAKRACFMEAVLADEIRRAFKLSEMDEAKCVKPILTKGNDEKKWTEIVPLELQQLQEAISILNHDKNNILPKP